MKKRLLYLLKTYALTVILFIVAKIVFMLCYADGQELKAGDYLSVVGHGLSLDLSTALYFLIVPFLVSLLSLWVGVTRWVLRVYYAVGALAFALAPMGLAFLYLILFSIFVLR